VRRRIYRSLKKKRKLDQPRAMCFLCIRTTFIVQWSVLGRLEIGLSAWFANWAVLRANVNTNSGYNGSVRLFCSSLFWEGPVTTSEGKAWFLKSNYIRILLVLFSTCSILIDPVKFELCERAYTIFLSISLPKLSSLQWGTLGYVPQKGNWGIIRFL
jgi:hypothetical protein